MIGTSSSTIDLLISLRFAAKEFIEWIVKKSSSDRQTRDTICFPNHHKVDFPQEGVVLLASDQPQCTMGLALQKSASSLEIASSLKLSETASVRSR